MDKFSLDRSKLPQHVAIIMDGNGRWAYQRSLARSEGHRQGVHAVRRVVRAALELGIPYLTLFSFSAENWSRPAQEVSYLFGLLRRFVRQDVAELHASGVRIRVIGERSQLDRDIVDMIDECESLTVSNTTLNLIIAFNYGGRQELAAAVRKIADSVLNGTLQPSHITPEHIDQSLYTTGIPEPDLLIRTSGEKRISNFLLWQLAYTEFVFVEEQWPEFSQEILVRAIVEFYSRDRRYGGLTAKAI